MPVDLIIRNGSVMRESGVERADIAIENESIIEIAPTLSGPAREEIDASNLHVFPGVIDPHVHFNEPGRTEWEGIATGSSALAAGGGTLFFDMPLNSAPPVLDRESFDAKRALAEEKSVTDFALWGGLTPTNLDHLEALAERGVIGFKAFMCNSGIEDFTCVDDDTLHRGMTIAAKLKLPVAVHAEDQELTAKLTRESIAAGKTSPRDYLATRPIEAELIAIRKAIAMARDTGCSLHIVHVSSDAGISEIIAGRGNSEVFVSCETCPHYLLLNENNLLEIGARAKCAPPLRPERTRQALVNQLANGFIDFVGSDHSPSPESMKQSDDFFKIWGGIAGVQSTLPALLSLEPRPDLKTIARVTSSTSAGRFNIARKGSIRNGLDADLALVGLDARYELRRDDLLDRHKLSPYVGRSFRGRIIRTILRGQTIAEHGKTIGQPRGRFVRPTRA